MNRTQIYLPAPHQQKLRREARARGISMTELVRRIVADHVEGRRGIHSFAKEDVMAFIGIGASGHADTSERHDEVLDEAMRGGRIR